MANTAALVSLIPLGSQRILAYSELIGRTANETPPTVQDVGIDHGRADVLVPQEFLNRPDIGTLLEQTGSKRVPAQCSGS